MIAVAVGAVLAEATPPTGIDYTVYGAAGGTIALLVAAVWVLWRALVSERAERLAAEQRHSRELAEIRAREVDRLTEERNRLADTLKDAVTTASAIEGAMGRTVERVASVPAIAQVSEQLDQLRQVLRKIEDREERP